MGEAIAGDECATESTMILPLFHQMTEDEQDYVIESIETIASRAVSPARV